MLDKLKKHSVKIFVFTINILLAAIAVLIIREKDQARLLENAQKEFYQNGNPSSSSLPSFENSVSVESSGSDSSQANVSEPSPAGTPVAAPTPAPAVSVPANSASSVTPPPVAAPTPAPKPSNAKTRTS